MGQTMSHYENSNGAVNGNCPVCLNSGKLPNLIGRFYLLNEFECKCNGCNTIYEKSLFYKKCLPMSKQL
jgi:hypothetical protein